MATFQYASDLHIEHHPQSTFKFWSNILTPVAPHLILNGDIVAASSPKQVEAFLKWCKLNWDEVIYIPGNHEYYNTSILDGDLVLGEICQRLGVHYLNRKSVMIDGVLIIGCTLWSRIPPQDVTMVSEMLNDFHLIKDHTVEKHNMMHQFDLVFIHGELNRMERESPNTPVIVATHHCPNQDLARLSNPTYDLSSGFGTDVIHRFSIHADRIRVWLYGHSHINASKHFDGIRVTCNQLGYNPRSFKSMKYHPDCIVKV